MPPSVTRELKKLLGAVPKGEMRTYAELAAKVWMLQIMQGKFPFLKEMLERTEGKVPDRIAGADGGPIGHDLIFEALAKTYGLKEALEVQARVAGEAGALEYEPEEMAIDG